jgi:ABC-2 type transport system permease protein
MNLRGAFALMRGTWASWLQYRSFFFLLAFGWMIPPLVYMLVWSSAAGQGELGGLNRGDLVTYYLALILVNQLTYSQTNWTVGDMIRYGKMSSLLVRPLPPLFDALASETAGKVVYMVFVIPAVALLALLLRPDLGSLSANWRANGPAHLLAFLPALAMAWGLRFFWGYWLALLAFWAARSDGLLAVQDALIFLFGGQVAPLRLLPGALFSIAAFLPFRYMAAFPVEVLVGQLSPTQIWAGLAVQAAWLALALALSTLLWRAGLRRYVAVGG